MKPELVPVRKLASGETLSIPVFRFRGDPARPSAYLQASLHGSEVQGNWVIAELLERLPKVEILGDITMVPCANPFAQNHKVGEYTVGRFDPTDGDNWNRAFQDFTALAEKVSSSWPEAKAQLRKLILEKLGERPASESHSRSLARTLQSMAVQHDFLLDLHCASICETYAYVPAYAFASLADLPARHAIRIGPVFGGAMDEAFFTPWWALAKRVEAQTGSFPPVPQGFTLELGHQDWCDPERAARQAEGILYFLAQRDVVRGNFKKMEFSTRYACDLKDFHTDFSTSAGFLKLKAKLGEPHEADQPYCEYLHFKDFRREVVNNGQKRVPLVFTNASSVHEGIELGKSLTNYFEI